MPSWSGLYFQEAFNWGMVYLDLFHGWLLTGLACVVVPLGVGMVAIGVWDLTESDMLEIKYLEMLWSVLPMLLLLGIVLPSFKLLYFIDEDLSWGMSLSAIGYQWYWDYFYPDFFDESVESYCLSERVSSRVLDVGDRCVVPVGTPIRVLVSGGDVIHSWTMPSLGVKVDAIPGRINSTSVLSGKPGVLYGQCSEICGVNHSFMPIVLEIVPLEWFSSWVSSGK